MSVETDGIIHDTAEASALTGESDIGSVRLGRRAEDFVAWARIDKTQVSKPSSLGG